MTTINRHCTSLESTERFATDLAAVLRAGDIVRLDGEMGAGKTTLVRGVAGALGVNPDSVSSPTYVLMNLYERPGNKPTIAHLDCYRMGDADELDALGWDRVTDGSAMVLIEWSERIADALPAEAARVSITPTGETARRFTIEVPDSWMDRAGFPGLQTPPDTVCPVTGKRVPGESPTWPFADEKSRMADLHGWLEEKHVISRPMEERDLEEGV